MSDWAVLEIVFEQYDGYGTLTRNVVSCLTRYDAYCGHQTDGLNAEFFTPATLPAEVVNAIMAALRNWDSGVLHYRWPIKEINE